MLDRKEHSKRMENDKGGQVVKSAAKKVYKGFLFIVFLAIMMLCTVLVLTFLAAPDMMLDTIRRAFGLE